MGTFKPLIGCSVQMLEVMIKKKRLPRLLEIRDLAELLVWSDFPNEWQLARDKKEEIDALMHTALMYEYHLLEACRDGLLSFERQKIEYSYDSEAYRMAGMAPPVGKDVEIKIRIRIDDYCKHESDAIICKLLRGEEIASEQEPRIKWSDNLSRSEIKRKFDRLTTKAWDNRFTRDKKLEKARLPQDKDDGREVYYDTRMIAAYVQRDLGKNSYTLAEVNGILTGEELNSLPERSKASPENPLAVMARKTLPEDE